MRQVMSVYIRHVVIFIALLCSLIPLSVSAEETSSGKSSFFEKTWLKDLIWHGFISQNFILTDENNFLGSSSDGSFKSNEAALNASWKPSESLQLSLQGIYKQIGTAEPKGGRIDYAIADWRIVDEFSHGFGVRAGRLKNPYGFFNETRDVAATNISILLPESIYIDYLSQLFHSSDSAGFYGHREMVQGTFSYNMQYGRPILNDQITRSIVGAPDTRGTFSDERSFITRFAYEDAAGFWRAALSYIYFIGDFKAGPNDFMLGLSDGDLTTQQLLLSLELNVNDLQVTTEIQRRDTELEGIYPFNILEKGLSYYLQFAYNLTSNLKVYVRRDEVFRFKDDKKGKDYIAQIKAIDPSSERQFHSTFAKDTTLGFRYSPNFEWSFALEVHHIDGTYWLPDIENPDIGAQKRYWNMFLAQVAYRF